MVNKIKRNEFAEQVFRLTKAKLFDRAKINTYNQTHEHKDQEYVTYGFGLSASDKLCDDEDRADKISTDIALALKNCKGIIYTRCAPIEWDGKYFYIEVFEDIDFCMTFAASKSESEYSKPDYRVFVSWLSVKEAISAPEGMQYDIRNNQYIPIQETAKA